MDYPELVELLNVSSVSSDIAGINKALEVYVGFFSGLPVSFEYFDKNDSPRMLLIKSRQIEDDSPRILLVGHIDTILPAEKIKVRTEGNKLFGSGTQDMKGGLIVILNALRALHKKLQLKNIDILVNPNEELGARGAYFEELKSIGSKYDYIFVFESTLDGFPEAPVNAMSVVWERRGFMDFTLEITGPGGHSGIISKKEDRHNTNLIAAGIVIDLEAAADYELGTTINTGLIAGGEAINSLAAKTVVKCEARFFLESEASRIEDFLIKLKEQYSTKDINISLDISSKYPPLSASQKTKEFVKILQKMGEYLDIQIMPETRKAGSDAAVLQVGNRLAVILDGFGVRGGAQHSLYEYLNIDSLGISEKLVTEMLLSINEKRIKL